MSIVLDQKNYQIVPFKFNKDLKEVVNNYNSNKDIYDIWNIEKSTSAEYLLKYINNLVTDNLNEKGTIGVCFNLELRSDKLINLGIPKEKGSNRVLYHENSKYNFNYEFIKVYLFESKVGFLVYSLKFNDDINSIIEGNHAFKKYKYSGSYESLEEVIANKIKVLEIEKNKTVINEEAILRNTELIGKLKEYETSVNPYYNIDKSEEKKLDKIKPLKRSTIISNIIGTLDIEVEDYFTSAKEPDYSHMFTFVRLPKGTKEEDIKQYLFLLKNGVKNNCKPTDVELDINTGDGNIHLYKNFWWGVSMEALTCICVDTENEASNSFNNSYKGTIENVYLYVYIIMLHMRYGLLRYITKASTLSKEILDIDKSTNDIEKLNSLQKEIIQFDFRGIFNELFNITPHIKVFDVIRDKLRIDFLNTEIQTEISNLTTLTNLYTEKNQKKHKEKVERTFQLLAVALAGLVCSTYVRDTIESLNGMFYLGATQWYWLVPIMPIVLIGVMVLLVVKVKK